MHACFNTCQGNYCLWLQERLFGNYLKGQQSGHGVKTTDFPCASSVYQRSQPSFKLDKHIGRNISPLDSTPKVWQVCCPQCAAGARRCSRCNDRPPAAIGRALAVAANGGPSGGVWPDWLGAGGRSGVGAISHQSSHQGDSSQTRTDREAYHSGRGVCWRECRLRRRKVDAGKCQIYLHVVLYLSSSKTQRHIFCKVSQVSVGTFAKFSQQHWARHWSVGLWDAWQSHTQQVALTTFICLYPSQFGCQAHSYIQ